MRISVILAHPNDGSFNHAMAQTAVVQIDGNGHRAFFHDLYDDERLCAAFSHKLAAHLAGLGWIGKSCLLVAPELGLRVRWASILTDAPLQMTGKPMGERCGTCNECVTICPVQAFTGELFRQSEPREKRYDASKCDRYFAAMRKQDAEVAVCGLCLYACPHGNRQSGKLTNP